MNNLPKSFDIIVVGTGFAESILSAAASRIGKDVLHIDDNDYYGGIWTSFNLDNYLKLSYDSSVETNLNVNVDNNKNDFVLLGNDFFKIKDFSYEWHIPDNKTSDNDEEWCQKKFLDESRKFNFDLVPKLHYARGEFVELLIYSNIARYTEFRSISRVLTVLNDQIQVVPCSRSDVFANNKVSVIEKRMLMKLFGAIHNGTLNYNVENKTLKQVLKEEKLTQNLIHHVLYAIAMGSDNMPCKEGVQNLKRFINSLGRFGKTPFLFASYGSGELAQAFCRLSAVFGGVYALNQPIKELIYENDKIKGIIVGDQKITADIFILGADKAPKHYIKMPPEKFISRAIFVTNQSLLEDEKEHLTLLVYPPKNEKNSIFVIETGCLTGTCPKGLYLVHLISPQTTNPKEDFDHFVSNFFQNGSNENKPKILLSTYFSLPDYSNLDLNTKIPNNIYICPGPDTDLDYDNIVKFSEKLFEKIYPGRAFLPRAPDPEEILMMNEEDFEAERQAELKNTKIATLLKSISEEENKDNIEEKENVEIENTKK